MKNLEPKNEKVLVTGGAGFIGSHLVNSLIKENEVLVIDDLSHGKKEFLNPEAEFYKESILDCRLEDIMKDVDRVFHLAANPNVRNQDTKEHLNRNFLCTYEILEAMRRTSTTKIVFSSSSTVYGEAEIPTTINHPTIPISLYGAMKLSSEALIYSFSHTFEIKSWVYRFANVVGSNMQHGVIYDFINKLKDSPKELEILGDGNQRKSYIYIEDCISAIRKGLELKEGVNLLNIGTESQMVVQEIAEIVSEEMGLEPDFFYTGGKRGWKGDVPEMLLKPEKLTKLGWEPKFNSKEAVRKATRDLLQNF